MANGERQPLTIQAFGGINKLHTRELGHPSQGKNFWTRNGSLVTREGCGLLGGTPFTGIILSIHSAAKAGGATRLLVQEGTNLWHRPEEGEPWVLLKSNVVGGMLASCRWQDFVILVNGTEKLAYDIAAGTLADLQDTEGVGVPDMEFVANWKFRIFGWGPNSATPNYLWFNAYDANKDISKDAWSPEFFLNVTGDAGTPILAVIPYENHMLILSQRGYWRVYGDTEDNFTVTYGGSANLYHPLWAKVAGDMVIWLGLDAGVRRIYAYTGTGPAPISTPIEELLQDFNLDGGFACGFMGQYWLFLPDGGAGKTTALVFDVVQKAWYYHEFPAVFTCVTSFGDYMAKELLHVGLADAGVAKLDPDEDKDFAEPIEAEVVIGPFSGDARRMRPKLLWLEAEPRNDFSVDVYLRLDDNEEYVAGTVEFAANTVPGLVVKREIRVKAGKGRNITLRLVSTDKINELQKATLTVAGGQVK